MKNSTENWLNSPYVSELKKTPFLNIKGIRTKTINIDLEEGKFTYKFANNKYIGLPQDAYILAITTRPALLEGFSPVTIDNRPISPFYNVALLTIRSKINQSDLLNEIPLQVLQNGVVNIVDFNGNVLTQPFNIIFWEPIQNNCINWISSFVNFPSSPTLSNTDSLEFQIIYCMKETYFPKITAQNWYNNLSLAGCRASVVSINTFANQRKYKFSKSSKIEIPANAYIIGFQPLLNVIASNGNPTVSADVQNSSFITIKRGDKTIIDKLIYNYNVNPSFGLPYIPIEPLKVSEFDTQNSEIECANPSLLTDGKAFNILFYYVCDQRSEADQILIKSKLNCYY